MNANENTTNPIRAARERAGLSRAELAVRARLGTSTIFLAEVARHASDRTIQKIARALRLDPTALRPTQETR